MVSAANVELDEYVVLDFETTGLHPHRHRVIEVGAYIVRNHKILDSFTSLCNPGKKLPSFIVKFTGITDEMLVGQPTPEQVMRRLHGFLGNRPIIAHNAAFDSKFLVAEMNRVGQKISNPFVCSLLLSRRLFPQIRSHKLSNLQSELGIHIGTSHQSHRALDDAFVTVALFSNLLQTLRGKFDAFHVDWALLHSLSKVPKAKVKGFLESYNLNGSCQSGLSLSPKDAAANSNGLDKPTNSKQKKRKRQGSLASAFSSSTKRRRSNRSAAVSAIAG